jgi:hypothetical protein
MGRGMHGRWSMQGAGLIGVEPLTSWRLQLVTHARANHDVLAEWVYRAPRGKRKIGQSEVSRDAEAAIASRQVPKYRLQPFVPDNGVLVAGRVARGGSTRWGGATLLPVLTDPFVEIMHGAQYCQGFGKSTCELDSGWHGLISLQALSGD